MNRLILVAAASVFAVSAIGSELPTVKPERQGMSSDRLERIQAMQDRYTSDGKIAGTLTAVLRNGKVVHTSASGQKSATDDRPIEMDDLFRIYSMSKPITATAAMQLYEQGKFQLTDPVSKYIPELKDLQVLKDGDLVPAEKEMTMQHLLSHTAGLSYGFDPNDPVDQAYREADLFAAKDLDEFAQKVAKLPLKYEPGAQWHYSIAVDITGLVVERISGQSFDEYLEEHIFEPLDMQDTFFAVPEDKLDRFLPNHYLDPKDGQAKILTRDMLAA
ncbi:MAG: serine hydrolase domain-containing protein, partial [Pseudomonadota bacterium]